MANGLLEYVRIVAIFVADAPRATLSLLDQAATEVVMEKYPQYSDIHEHIFVRLNNLPCDDAIRNLR